MLPENKACGATAQISFPHLFLPFSALRRSPSHKHSYLSNALFQGRYLTIIMLTTHLCLATLVFTSTALALPSNLQARKLSYGSDLQGSLCAHFNLPLASKQLIQTAIALDPSLVQIGFFSDGLSSSTTDGKVASQTSFNNLYALCTLVESRSRQVAASTTAEHGPRSR